MKDKNSKNANSTMTECISTEPRHKYKIKKK